jgi:hypothetical protein
MPAWTQDQLNKIGRAEELQIESRRSDGTLRKPVTIWVVRDGDDLFIRPVNGRESSWFRGTQARHEGRIRAGSVGADVTFEDADPASSEPIDAAYREKYRRYAANIVNSVLTPKARAATLRLVPRAPGG